MGWVWKKDGLNCHGEKSKWAVIDYQPSEGRGASSGRLRGRKRA